MIEYVYRRTALWTLSIPRTSQRRTIEIDRRTRFVESLRNRKRVSERMAGDELIGTY